MAFKAKSGEDKHRSHTVDDAILEATKEVMVGLNVSISAKKRAMLKSKAAINGETLQEIVTQAIDRYLE